METLPSVKEGQGKGMKLEMYPAFPGKTMVKTWMQEKIHNEWSCHYWQNFPTWEEKDWVSGAKTQKGDAGKQSKELTWQAAFQ